jgi:hypothetical protein
MRTTTLRTAFVCALLSCGGQTAVTLSDGGKDSDSGGSDAGGPADAQQAADGQVSPDVDSGQVPQDAGLSRDGCYSPTECVYCSGDGKWHCQDFLAVPCMGTPQTGTWCSTLNTSCFICDGNGAGRAWLCGPAPHVDGGVWADPEHLPCSQ